MRTLLSTALVAAIAGVVVGDESEVVTIDNWGVVVDPDNDCKVAAADGKVTITVPGALHDLNKRNGMNAPRVLQEVVGDFQLTVKVTGEFKPGPESTLSSGLRFNSGGLLLWHDEENYIRLERNIMVSGTSTYCLPPLCEIFSEGKYRGINKSPTAEPYFQGASTWLRLKREGDYFRPALSHDGEIWEELKRTEVILPDKLLIGVSAINTSSTAHTVTFESLSVIKG